VTRACLRYRLCVAAFSAPRLTAKVTANRRGNRGSRRTALDGYICPELRRCGGAVSARAAYESGGRPNVRGDCLGRQCSSGSGTGVSLRPTMRSVNGYRLHDRAFAFITLLFVGIMPLALNLLADLARLSGRQSARASGNRVPHGVLNTSAPTWWALAPGAHRPASARHSTRPAARLLTLRCQGVF
jgi:hypothetical protein